jgi:hypothetical protein
MTMAQRTNGIRKKKGVYVSVIQVRDFLPATGVTSCPPVHCVKCGQPAKRVSRKYTPVCLDCFERERNDG